MQPVEEARGPPRRRGRRASRRQRPGDGEVLAGPGDADVEQPALLLDLLGRLGVGDRDHPVGDADHEDGVPLQALGGVQRRERHAVDGRGVLGVGPLVELGHEVAQRGVRPDRRDVVGEPGERGQRLPPVADRAPAGGRLGGPPAAGEHRPDRGRQAAPSVVVRRPGGPAQQQPRLAHLGPVEEPLAAAQHVGDAGVGQRLLVGLALPVGAEQHGDLARRTCPAATRVRDPLGDPPGLGRLVGQLAQVRCRAGLALGDQLEPAVAAQRCLLDQPVGEVDHLRRRPVVTDQPHLLGALVPLPEAEQELRRRSRRRCRSSGAGRRRRRPRRCRRATGRAAPAAAG